MASIIVFVVARMLWLQCPLLDGSEVVLVADAEFIRSWRENRP